MYLKNLKISGLSDVGFLNSLSSLKERSCEKDRRVREMKSKSFEKRYIKFLSKCRRSVFSFLNSHYIAMMTVDR